VDTLNTVLTALREKFRLETGKLSIIGRKTRFKKIISKIKNLWFKLFIRTRKMQFSQSAKIIRPKHQNFQAQNPQEFKRIKHQLQNFPFKRSSGQLDCYFVKPADVFRSKSFFFQKSDIPFRNFYVKFSQ